MSDENDFLFFVSEDDSVLEVEDGSQRSPPPAQVRVNIIGIGLIQCLALSMPVPRPAISMWQYWNCWPAWYGWPPPWSF